MTAPVVECLLDPAGRGDPGREALTEDATLDARIAAAFEDGATSGDISQLLREVEAAAKAADASADGARARALDPLLSGGEVKLARREMDDTSFSRDRLTEAASRLGERVAELKALEADRRMWAEHERVETERDRLAGEMARMADPIAQIAHIVSRIEICDREIGRLNATSAAKFGYIRPVLSGAAPTITALFQDAFVWDAFIAVATLPSPPVVSGGARAKGKMHAKRSASSPATLYHPRREQTKRPRPDIKGTSALSSTPADAKATNAE